MIGPHRPTDRLALPLVLLIFTLVSALAVNPYHFGDGDNSITIPLGYGRVMPGFDPLPYAGGGVAMIIECLTNNPSRTAPDMRAILERGGGNLATRGAVSFQS